jgi:hypothetical protein
LADPEEKVCVKPPIRVNVPAPTDGSVEPVLLLTSGGLELKFHSVKVDCAAACWHSSMRRKEKSLLICFINYV